MQHKKRLHYLRRFNRKKLVAILCVGLVGIIATLSISASQNSASSIEAENSALSQHAYTCDASTASANKFVLLGSNNCGSPHKLPSSNYLGGKTNLKNPMHFNDTYHYFPTVKDGFHQLEFTVQTRGPNVNDGYYWSQTFYWQKPDNSKVFDGGYFGIQNFATSHGNKPIAIFSIWNVTKAVSSGYIVPFGNEGSGVSVRIPIVWQTGKTYRLWVQKSSDNRGSSSNFTWWEAYVKELPSGAPKMIGAIEVPASKGNISSNTTVTFHERYIGPINSTCNIGASIGVFTNIMANNGLFRPVRMTHAKPDILECKNKYRVEDVTNGYQSRINI